MLNDLIINICRANIDKNAVAIDNKLYTYGDILFNITRISHSLKIMKVSSSIGLILDNSIEFIYLYLTALINNWMPIVYDCNWKAAELKNAIELFPPEIVFVDAKYLINISSFYNLNQMIVLDSEKSLHNWYNNFEINSINHFEYAIYKPESPVYAGFTSGTTSSQIKGFVQQKKAWLLSFRKSSKVFETKFINSTIVTGSFAHSLHIYNFLDGFLRGNIIYILKKFDPIKLIEVLNKARNSILVIVPTVLRKFLIHTDEANNIFNNVFLLLTSSSKLDIQTEDKLLPLFPQARFYEYYGASELGFVSYRTIGDKNDTSNGKIFPGVQVKIIDGKTYEQLSEGKIGKIYVYSDYVMLGYLINSSIQCLHDNLLKLGNEYWCTAGDIGYIDKDRKIYLVCRENDIIKSGDKNVFPQEVENVLKNLGNIADAFVFSLPDTNWGEKVCALILFKQDKIYDRKNLLHHCKIYLSDYKCPKTFYYTKSLPYTTSGKIARAVLRDLIENSAIPIKEIC